MGENLKGMIYLTMNYRTYPQLLCFFLLVFAGPVDAFFETSSVADFRPVSGDDVQHKRTTSINWPGGSRRKPAKATAERQTVEEKRFRVLVDVGHGGHDFGAPGKFGTLEKDLCLAIAKNVKSRLERFAKLNDFSMEVRLSRESDHFISLRERVDLANSWSADLFISIHGNSSPVPRARGFEVYFLSYEATDAEASRLAEAENLETSSKSLSQGVLSILSDLQTNTHILESSRFAEAVYSALAQRLRPNGRGVRQAPFTVLSGTQMPALLIEVGYLTNPDEAAALRRPAYQTRISTGISEGVIDFALRMRQLGRNSYHRPGKRTT